MCEIRAFRYFWPARAAARFLVNKEFTAFFDDPDRKRLTAWQSFIFSTISIVGWVLGLILLAAVSGVTQSS